MVALRLLENPAQLDEIGAEFGLSFVGVQGNEAVFALDQEHQNLTDADIDEIGERLASRLGEPDLGELLRNVDSVTIKY